MKAGVGPVRYASNQPMLQRVEMQIVHMMPIVAFVSDQMLPIPPLPDTSFASGSLRCGQHLCFRQPLGKRELDDLPAKREISVAVGQRPDAVHVIRKYDPGINMEGVAGLGGADCFTQQIDVADKEVASAITQVDREEIGCARHPGAAVSRHGGSSLSVVLAGGPYRWIGKALSTLRHQTRPHRRRIDVAGA
jgi:hypothetical protein